MNKVRNIQVLGVVCGVVLVLQGCDKIATFTSYFSGQEKTAKTQAPVAASPKVQTPAVVKENVPVEKPKAVEPPVEAKREEPKNVLAKVGNWTITVEEFKERLKAIKEVAPEYDVNDVASNKMILQDLVRQQLLVKDAEDSGLANSKDVVMAVDEFRRTLLVRDIATKLVEGMEVTDQEAETYYNENKDKPEFEKDVKNPTTWKVREIVVETEQEAKDLLVLLVQGADFIQTVKDKSKSKSAWNKGDLGELTEFPFEKMESAVATLEVGGVSNVFTGPEGFYIVKLEEKKGGDFKPFEELKEEIKKGLLMQKQQEKILAHLEELGKKVAVEVNDKLLEE